MSLATRVFALFSTLMILMLGSQWYMMRSITQEVSSELGKVAFSVAKDTASYFILSDFSWLSTNMRPQTSHQTTTHERKLRTGKGLVSSSVTVVEVQAPSVEVRIRNQRTDDAIELISGNRTTSIPLPRDQMNAAVERLERQMILSTLFILGVGLVLAALLAKRLMRPVRELSKAAEALSKGELGTQIDDRSRIGSSELQSSVDTFNMMSRDLADMQKQNQALQANAHYKELGYISSGLAHSIRNPLNTLGLTIEQIVESPTDSNRSSLVESAYRQIKRIDDWVKTFMTFALGADAKTQNIDIQDIIHNIQLEAKQLRQDVTIETSLPENTHVEGIEAELHAIFQSLLINAVEVSPANGTVSLAIEQDNGGINCLISDQGPGIEPEMQESLFIPHKTTKSKGSGMGLYMAQKLAENRYTGSIELAKSDEQGTEIAMYLNRKRQLL